MKHKAISLLSGGLDSILATIIISKQGIDVTAIKFLTPFGCDLEDSSCGFDASHIASRFGFKLKICPMGEEYIKMVKNPAYGWGKNMNPCIDCRIMMIKWVKDIMNELGAEFIITGEVLNQRPMSQTKQKLTEIEEQTGLNGFILRPLSAKLLSPTIAEQNKIVDREQLFDIEGRSRSKQFEIAQSFELTKSDYGQPAGGCLLTDPSFSNKLRDFWSHNQSTKTYDIELLKIGRHFRYSPETKIIVGRNETENIILKQHIKQEITSFEFDVPAPIIIVQGKLNETVKDTAIKLGIKYTKHSPTKVTIRHMDIQSTESVDNINSSIEMLHVK